MAEKKANDYIPEVAKSLGLSDELVRDVVGFYWKVLRNKIDSLDYSSIDIRGLGVVTLRYAKARKRYERSLINIQHERFEGLSELKKAKEIRYVEKLRPLIDLMTEEHTVRIDMKKKRYEEYKESLAKQG